MEFEEIAMKLRRIAISLIAAATLAAPITANADTGITADSAADFQAQAVEFGNNACNNVDPNSYPSGYFYGDNNSNYHVDCVGTSVSFDYYWIQG
jgi:hypothetical protein